MGEGLSHYLALNPASLVCPPPPPFFFPLNAPWIPLVFFYKYYYYKKEPGTARVTGIRGVGVGDAKGAGCKLPTQEKKKKRNTTTSTKTEISQLQKTTKKMILQNEHQNIHNFRC
jgi:hypothetical protein